VSYSPFISSTNKGLETETKQVHQYKEGDKVMVSGQYCYFAGEFVQYEPLDRCLVRKPEKECAGGYRILRFNLSNIALKT
jgi:hypothetical protein